MRPSRISITCALVACGLVGLAAGTDSIGSPEAEQRALFGGMPKDVGRLEVFGFCGSCHSIILVLQQGLTRAVWDEVLVEMVRDQEMAPLRDDDRRKVLDYLEKYYGPDRRAKKMSTTTDGSLSPPPQGTRSCRTPSSNSMMPSTNFHWSQVDRRAVGVDTWAVRFGR